MKIIIFSFMCVVIVTSCGFKGPLYLPKNGSQNNNSHLIESSNNKIESNFVESNTE